MYTVVLVFSLVIWALVIAVIVSTPSDVRRTVRLLQGFSPRHESAVRPARMVQEDGRMARSSRQRNAS